MLTGHIYGQRALWRVSFTLRAVHLRFSMWFVIRLWGTIALGFVLFVDAGWFLQLLRKELPHTVSCRLYLFIVFQNKCG